MNRRIEAIREKLSEMAADSFLCYSHPNYRYLSGFTGSLAVVIITPSQAFIMSDFRYRTQIGQEVADYEYVEIKGRIEETVLRQIEAIGLKKLAFESAHLTYRQYSQLKSVDTLELVPAEDWVENLRAVKDNSEIELIERAASIVDTAIETIAREVMPGMTEKEVSNRINAIIRSLGGKKEAFDLIVASGPRSALPHGAPSDRRIEAAEPITIDIGAQYEGYHSDLTRTIWIDKIKSPQVLEIFGIVEEAQTAAIEAIRPDMPCVDIDAVARNLISEAGYGDFFGHGLGHGVGLEVHESPIVSRLGKGNVKPGMVFTVEPGIYIPDVGGVRIEDMIVVTEDGCRRLTTSAHRFDVTS